MECRAGCGACCIAPSINESFVGMPQGKPAGVRCVHLDEALRCGLFNDPRRPAICSSFLPSPEFCGSSQAEAVTILQVLEVETRGPG